MESYYFFIVVCLVALAVADLVVGVSNDAVNFLNSALGSKVTSRKVILTVASVGIFFGVLSSSGMMEIARKGIFNPEMFAFADIMVIFLAVMVTDIILLDLFNTFGMPTSTTVSIMFELLGAAFAVALIKIFMNGDQIGTVGNYLNMDNALLIIGGIFLSVLIAFTFGVIVQYIVRAMFSFNFANSLKKYGPYFAGLAITTITYFLLIKGLKGSSLIPENLWTWIETNSLLLIGGILVFWTVVCLLLAHLFKVNVLKVVVLAGTFSLAMAFAGNDLVNFVGVPLAGLQSYEIYNAAGSDAQLSMGVLGDQLQTNSWILLGAGAIMIITLWFSGKARSVTETEINLARQSVGSERFRSNLVSRIIVRTAVRMGNAGNKLLPENTRAKIDHRFRPASGGTRSIKDEPAFDLVRASVNLMLASVLIAVATSLKLPLSTTYVSFMVAMGTSLADRAWDRDSAVYRVAGVINVISGWLFTALIAFVVAGILAVTIYYIGFPAVIGFMLLTIGLIVRSYFMHKKLEKKKKTPLHDLMKRDRIVVNEVFRESEHRISSTLYKVSFIMKDLMRGLDTGDRKTIKKAKTEVERYNKEFDDLSTSFYYYLKKIDSENAEEGQFYLHVLNYLQNISQSIGLIGEKVFGHVQNMHKPVQQEKMQELAELTDRLSGLFLDISDLMGKDHKGSMHVIEERSNEILLYIDQLELRHIKRVKGEQSSARNSMLYIAILLECRDILNNFTELVGLYEKRGDIPVLQPGFQPSAAS